MRKKKKNKDTFLSIYAGAICLYVLAAADVLWLDKIPLTFFTIIVSLLSIIKIQKDRQYLNNRIMVMSFPLFLFCFCSIFLWSNPFTHFFYIFTVLALFLTSYSILLLPIKEKEYLLNSIIKTFSIILIISISVWILFVGGVELPHSNVIFHPNGFHEYYDYYFFRLSAKNDDIFDMILPRFSSIFLEPGQLATPCAFIFFINGSKFSRKNAVFLIAILLSFSLIAYGLLFFSLVARIFIRKGRHFIFHFVIVLAMLGGTFLAFSQYADDDNPINMFILSRLEYDEEKGIVGNNRSHDDFDVKYEKFKNSSDYIFGISRQLEEKTDWTIGNSGYKKFVVRRGIIGFILLISFLFLLYYYNRCLSTIAFFCIVTIAFLVRDLLQSPLWLSLVIVGMYMLKFNNDLNIVKFNSNLN